MFDAEKYFESKGIDYHLSPEKNVSKGWVNISCPFPGCADSSWHCGTNPKGENFNCWKCEASGHVAQLIQEIERCSRKKAWAIFKSFGGGSEKSKKRHFSSTLKSESILDKKLDFPISASKNFPKLYLKYLKERGFDPDFLINKYDLWAGPKIGKFAYRIIIPIYYKRKMVSFTSRDVTGQSDIPYIHLSISRSLIDPKHCVYGYDHINPGKTIIIVEGVFDAWRIGDGAICIFGTEFIWDQVELILSKDPKEIITLFDADASKKGVRLANQFSGLGIKTKNFIIDRDDPDKLNRADLVRIRKLLK